MSKARAVQSTQTIVTIDGALHADVLHAGYRRQGSPTVHDIDSQQVLLPKSAADAISLASIPRPHVPIISGSDVGSPVADHANRHFGLPGHDPSRARLRLDKLRTSQHLRDAGLRNVAVHPATDIDQALRWANAIGYPVVAKPRIGFGSLFVSICRNDQDVRKALHEYGRTKHDAASEMDPQHWVRGALFLEEYIPGDQYELGFINVLGGHYLTHAWKIVHTAYDSVRSVYSAALLVDYADPVLDIIRPYCAQVCTALGIHHGISHLEVRVDNNQCRLIEAHARPMGASLPELLYHATGHSISNMLAGAMSNPDNIVQLTSGYTMHNHAMRVFIQGRGQGTFHWPTTRMQNDLRHSGASLVDMASTWKEGAASPRTTHVHSTLGYLGLLASSDAALMRALRRIRGWEQRGWFEA